MSTWEQNKPSEVDFWRQWAESGGLIWPDEFKRRQEPAEPLREAIASLLWPGRSSYRVLDVGAGPLTVLGKVIPSASLEIVAVDPLAAEYDAILATRGIVPLVRTTYAKGEELPFEDNSFDLVHMMNALDHCEHPVQVFGELMRVVKPGCFVFLSHATREGQRNGYSGLHQWDLFVDAFGHLCVTTRSSLSPTDLTFIAGGTAVIKADDRWHEVAIRKGSA